MEVWQAYEQQINFFTRRGDGEMRAFRFREYLENIYAQLLEVRAAAEGSARWERQICARLRRVFFRAWRLGYIEFWVDYDMLSACAPWTAKCCRFWMEHRNR